jgi:ankyrin repeat protein
VLGARKEIDMKRLLICTVMLLATVGCMSLPQKNARLLQAARAGDTENVKSMLDGGADINTHDKYGDTPLNLAIKNSQKDTASLLVSKGANVNAKGALDDTPLHTSIYKGDTEMASLLRTKGADDNLLNRYGLNPVEMQSVPAVEAKVLAVAQLLSSNGEWNDRSKARIQYDDLKTSSDKYLVNALVLQIIRGHDMRLRVLLLSIKLGISGSEEKLNNLLMVYGDKSMAEDYLNSGSSMLHDGASRWARSKGYNIRTGPGSNRSGWGRF